MALLQVNFVSESLMRSVPMQVILPVDRIPMPGEAKPEFKPLKTLYLLHGIFGSYIDWVSGTNIQRWAEEKNLAVVMPSGDNSFYLDHASGFDNYGRFVGEELVEVTRRMFHLSEKREDTFIGGLSMGGYGAIRNGLKYHRNFSRIVAFSSALTFQNLAGGKYDDHFILTSKSYADSRFGDLEHVAGSDKDPWALIRNLKAEDAEIPKFYMACGTEDALYGLNGEYVEFLREQGVDVTYETGEGSHNWTFWHNYIRRALDWLPLDGANACLNSGHVSNDSPAD
ncbi:MAG: alpha/beta hydrolase-fold protein [Eubacteriales bacterium]|nr:alpha/beta hydrolase-fold protein [Eubacteriales bacterium]